MFKKIIRNKFILFLARTIDYRIGLGDNEKPDLPLLTVELALLSLAVKLMIILINFVTCAFVIANIIHHW
jgi:hypothetical protein